MSSKGRGKRQRSASRQDEPNSRPLKQVRLQLQNPGRGTMRENEQSQTPSRSMFEADSAPLEVSVAKFAESRAKELEALAKAVEQVGGNKLSFQHLPKHMRRRAMSHNIRRIPQRLRQKAQAELDKREKKGVDKRPSRRYRRRPSNLLSEYQRRQRRHMWLETHIWHAKRFKMTTAWGYRLPVHPSDKSLRACYRASTYHCLLQDVSYECCIQIKGPRQTIVDTLSHLTSTDTGLTFAARTAKTGQRWETVMVYAYDSYPWGAVAPVSFLWQPGVGGGQEEDNSEATENSGQGKEKEDRVLWLWCHPASYAEVWNQLTTACDRQLSASGDPAHTSSGDGSNCKNSAVSQPGDQQTQSESSPLGGTEVQFGPLKLRSLKDQLVKFRLTGPASNLVLSETLKPANIRPEKEQSEGGSGDCLGEKQRWWQTYYKAEGREEEFSAQTSCWGHVAKCHSPDALPRKAVVALTVRDPRVLMPTVRTKAALNTADSTTQLMTWDHLPSEAPVSPLMDEGVREEVFKTKLTEQEINGGRSKLLVPGSIVELGDEESRIPVLLLHQPGTPNNSASSRSGVGSGWDILAPRGWGMAFWVAMVYRGARVGGLRESRSLASRIRGLHFPQDYPDTAAGRRLQQETRGLAVEKYVRRPPAKRVNHPRLGVPAPFHCPWVQLVGEWRDNGAASLSSVGVLCAPVIRPSSGEKAGVCSESVLGGKAEEKPKETPNPEGSVKERGGTGEQTVFCGGDLVSLCSQNPDAYVLRCWRLLRALGKVTEPTKVKRNSKGKGQDTPSTRLSKHSQCLQKAKVQEHLGSIVSCTVSCRSRGVPVERAMICLPTATDLEQLAKDPKFTGPMERLHPCRKTPSVKAAAKKKKQPAVKTCLVGASKGAEKVTTEQKADEKENLASSKTERAEKQQAGKKEKKTGAPKGSLNPRQLEEKEELMEEPGRVADTANRPILGFLTVGDFDLGQGHGAGVGFCALAGLVVALRGSAVDGPLYVLVRNPSSRQYRFATLTV